MDSRPIVLDISSDEEGWGEIRGGGSDCGGGDDDYDWISELLDKVDREPDDSDDVVFVGEVMLNPKPSYKSSNVSENDLDDDCVVLDGDPDKPVVIENNTVGDSDDLLIVGEKGQIACRDYPHPRHLCAKYPFTSTPHERHCHQCHCYVCDSLAPCIHWGNTTSSIDHCHATDKDEFWKLQRRNLKQGDKPPLPVPNLPDTFVSMGPQQTIQIPPLTQLQPNFLSQNQVSRPTAIRACSTSANFGIPNITNQGRSQQYVLPINRLRSRSVSQQLLSTHSNNIRRDRRHSVGNLGPQFINSRAIIKRAGSAGVALTTNRFGYCSSNKGHVTQYSRNSSSMTTSNDTDLTRWRDLSSGMISDSNALHAPSQNTCGGFGNSMPSHHQVSSHPNVGSVFVNSVPSQAIVSSNLNIVNSFVNSLPSRQATSQPNMGSNFENSVPSQPQVSSQPSLGNSYVNSRPSPETSSQPNMGSNFENVVPSLLEVSFQPNTGRSFVHLVPTPPEVYGPPVPVSNDSLDGFQQENDAQNDQDPGFSDFKTSWVALTDQSNQLPLPDNSQIQSADPTCHPPFVPEFDPQIPVSTNASSLDFQFDSWMLENQSVSGPLEVSVPSGLNLYSPEPSPVDAGFLFDF